MRHPNQRVIGITAAVLSALCWGSATVMSKGALDAFPPIILLNVQLLSSLAFVWLVIRLCKLQVVDRKGLLWVAALGVLEPGLAYFLCLIGLVYVEATSASLIQATEALMIAILAAAFFAEKLRMRFWVLSGFTLVGLFMVIGGSASSDYGRGVAGQLLIFGGTFAAAVYVILSSRVSNAMNPFVMIGYQQIAALMVALLALAVSLAVARGPISLPDDWQLWALAILSGIVQYALAFALYFYSMRYLRAASAGAFLNLVPVFGIVGACLFLGERISAYQVIGAVLTIGCVALMSLYPMAAPANHGAEEPSRP